MKSASDIRAELDALSTLLHELRDQQSQDSDSVGFQAQAALLDTEIERRKMLLVTLLQHPGAA